jgi:hypothetical protein
MKRVSKDDSKMLAEYDFSKGARGKYASRHARGSNVVVLEPDVAKLFSTSKMVNRSLRGLAKSLKSTTRR